MNIHVVALMKFKENHLFDAIELLKKLVSETRKEEGCLQYDLIEDKENKGHFFLNRTLGNRRTSSFAFGNRAPFDL